MDKAQKVSGEPIIPAGISGSCFLALGTLGGAATSTQIRDWLRQQGEKLDSAQVRGALHSLTRRNRPLVEVTRQGKAGRGAPNHWRITGRGYAVLAEDDGEIPCGTGWPA